MRDRPGLARLQEAIGPSGLVVGLDLTSQMLAEARRRHSHAASALVLGDALQLPFASGAFDAVFAAGLVTHLADARAGLRELARVCRVGGGLALFHPIGRAALARRHGREPAPDDLRTEPNIRRLLELTGWSCTSVDDSDDRYLVLANRPL